jgi:hypothetical protein
VVSRQAGIALSMLATTGDVLRDRPAPPWSITVEDLMIIYQLVVLGHVAAAVALLGGSLMGSPTLRSGVRRAGTVAELVSCLRLGRPLALLNPVAALLVLVTGAYLADATRTWTMGWVQVAVAFWIVNSIIAVGVVKPAVAALAAEAAATAAADVGGRLDALRWSPRWTVGGDLLMANDSAILAIMVLRLGLTASLLIVALTNGVVAAGRLALVWRRGQAAAASAPMTAGAGPP